MKRTSCFEDVRLVLQRFMAFKGTAPAVLRQRLLMHWLGTYFILRRWGCPEPVCLAGLYQSFYGTETFSYPTRSLTESRGVRKIIGLRAERLTDLFAMHQKASLWRSSGRGSSRTIVDRISRKVRRMSVDEYRDLVTRRLAKFLDPRPRMRAYPSGSPADYYIAPEGIVPPAAFAEFTWNYGN